MKPAEVAWAFQSFKDGASKLDGDGLLDAWIELEGKQDKVPDLDLQKSSYLESALVQKFGLMEWRKAVEARRNKK